HVHAHVYPGGSALAAAVAVHRLPEGLALWWLVSARRGPWWGAVALGLVGACSVLGYALSETLVDRFPDGVLVSLEALIAGSLLHVIAHHELAGAHEHGGAHHHGKHHNEAA